jgi:hypothetical protein
MVTARIGGLGIPANPGAPRDHRNNVVKGRTFLVPVTQALHRPRRLIRQGIKDDRLI